MNLNVKSHMELFQAAQQLCECDLWHYLSMFARLCHMQCNERWTANARICFCVLSPVIVLVEAPQENLAILRYIFQNRKICPRIKI